MLSNFWLIQKSQIWPFWTYQNLGSISAFLSQIFWLRCAVQLGLPTLFVPFQFLHGVCNWQCEIHITRVVSVHRESAVVASYLQLFGLHTKHYDRYRSFPELHAWGYRTVLHEEWIFEVQRWNLAQKTGWKPPKMGGAQWNDHRRWKFSNRQLLDCSLCLWKLRKTPATSSFFIFQPATASKRWNERLCSEFLSYVALCHFHSRRKRRC